MVVSWGTAQTGRRVGEFVSECCEVGLHEVGCSELHRAYVAWCGARKVWACGGPMFSRGLRLVIPDMGCWRPRAADGSRRRMYTGLRLLRRVVAPEAAE